MDAEEHSVIMQQVKELEVRGEAESPRDAAPRGSPHRGGAGGLWCLPAPMLGLGVRGAPGCAAGAAQELFAGLSNS